MKISKNFSFGTVEVEDTSTCAYYIIHFPAGFSIEVEKEEWEKLSDFVNNSIDFINDN